MEPHFTNIRTAELDALLEAVASLESSDEAYLFFEDLFTVTELSAMAQRFRVARMLLENHTTQQISEETGSSTATIARVNKCLHYGSGGYAMVIDRGEGKKETNGTE